MSEMPSVQRMSQVVTITGQLLARKVTTKMELVPLKADHNCPLLKSKRAVLELRETAAIQTNEEGMIHQVSNKRIFRLNSQAKQGTRVKKEPSQVVNEASRTTAIPMISSRIVARRLMHRAIQIQIMSTKYSYSPLIKGISHLKLRLQLLINLLC